MTPGAGECRELLAGGVWCRAASEPGQDHCPTHARDRALFNACHQTGSARDERFQPYLTRNQNGA